jgi:UDP-3-O-[3-hydroxymyristoyl] N-acetylglucosamine deacetylase
MSHNAASQNIVPVTALPPSLMGLGQPVMQKTLAKAVECSGIGVHSGELVNLRLCPAPINTGIVFVRTDLVNGARSIKAIWSNVVDTRMCTVIANDHDSKVATIEHLMAALHANGIDNAFVEIDGAEVPVMDGSSDSFVFLIDVAGRVEQNAIRREIEILAPVEIEHEGKRARLVPDEASRYTVTINFDRAPIMTQSCDVVLSADTFKNEISRARTFGFFEEVNQMQKLGLARGGSLDNSIVIKGNDVMNKDGLRYSNEFARHKVLDAIGDLALAGMPIKGHFQGHCTGHALNNRLLHALFAQTDAWRVIGEEAESVSLEQAAVA